jgi:hypothetical protein
LTYIALQVLQISAIIVHSSKLYSDSIELVNPKKNSILLEKREERKEKKEREEGKKKWERRRRN